jgi:ketohexokinase
MTKMDLTMAKILGIGNLVLDLILDVTRYPQEDDEMRALTRRFQCGGNVANSLYVLSQLGHQTAIVTTLAVDDASKQLKQTLQQRGIDTQYIQRFIKGATPTSYIQIAQNNGSRTITHFRQLPEVEFDHFAKIEIEDFDWLHFEGRNLDALEGMLNIAKTFLTHQPISLEVEKPREGIEALFGLANVLFFSQKYIQAKGFDSAETWLEHIKKHHAHAHIICTWGEQGAWYCSAGGSIEHQPAENIKPLDTLGAGDTFNAGVIDALIQGQSLQQAVQQASRLAARKCQQVGFDDLLSPLQTRKPIANVKHITSARATVVPAPGLKHKVVLIKHHDEIKAYENNCPHQDVPLDEAYKIDINPFEMTMKCSVHDAFFRIEDGVCIEGPCWRDELKTVAIEIDEQTGHIYLAQS